MTGTYRDLSGTPPKNKVFLRGAAYSLAVEHIVEAMKGEGVQDRKNLIPALNHDNPAGMLYFPDDKKTAL